MQRLGLGERATSGRARRGRAAPRSIALDHRVRDRARACRRRAGRCSCASSGTALSPQRRASTRGRPRRAPRPAPAACPSRRPTGRRTSRPSDERQPLAAALVDAVGGPDVGALLEQPAHADVGEAVLLVGDREEPQVAARAGSRSAPARPSRPRARPPRSSCRRRRGPTASRRRRRTASNGGCVQSRGSHGTTSVCPTNASDSARRSTA